MAVPNAGSPVWLALAIYSAVFSSVFGLFFALVELFVMNSTINVALSLGPAVFFGLLTTVFSLVVAYG